MRRSRPHRSSTDHAATQCPMAATRRTATTRHHRRPVRCAPDLGKICVRYVFSLDLIVFRIDIYLG